MTHVSLIFLQVTNIMRSIHNTPYMGNSKKNKEPSDQNYPENTATVILDRDDLQASQHNYKIAIRKSMVPSEEQAN